MKTLIISFAFVLALAASVAAQCPTQPAGPIVNPKNFCFDPGAGYSAVQNGVALTTGYRVTLKNAADDSVLTMVDIGKPALTSGVIKLSNFASFATLTPGMTVYAVTSAYGPGGETPDGKSVSFFKPSPPAAPGTAVVTP